ncbi:putative hemolysin [Bosea sp. 62]|nr:putative hemolysin [Bosea sp. 46]CAD5267584.1 putative hemolysin [Bosea sp. 21B]CAD5271422.1 putative hemolysin [Bosea sp. 7B]VVT55671.1 putative hemolysin [Bosea sp. EC-HK365B]VXB87095.1 putative hemolysin [Bosea sp. 29B]VXC16594.1 putative hemolysin [Bosea sp. 62]VXC25873.1 putative hemolysin [Bosea sp. 125]VXC68090.1 putative hemolysin [Bosea sp. 127]
MLTEILVVVVLTVINGVLAMSELAVVSSRPARLKVLSDQGSKGAAKAIRLAENPGRFLSTVQIGITLVGVLSGAFSGATLGARLSEWLGTQGFSNTAADALGVGTVVVLITYLSLIIGELVPKQIALRDAERVAARVAPAMVVLAKVASPLVWLLDTSGKLVLALLGQKGESEETVTEEEVRTIIAEAENAGVLERDEREMISGVMRLADRSARALMTPRREVEVIDLSDTLDEIRAQVRATRRNRLPVQDGEADSIIGIIEMKDLFEALADDKVELRSLVREAPVVLDTTGALEVLRALRATHVHMALVFDEYGHFEGIITSSDVLEAITGVFQDEDEEEPAIVTRADGSFLVAGWMQVDEFSHELGIHVPRDADYQTVAGFVLAEMNRLPNVGESFEKGHWRFEVVDLDGRRIDKLLVSRVD